MSITEAITSAARHLRFLGAVSSQQRSMLESQDPSRYLKHLAEQHKGDAIQESMMDPFDTVDLREPFFDDGYMWIVPQVPGAGAPGQPTLTWHGFANEVELFLAQTLCRRMETYSEFIVNGLANRVNYTVGTGYTFTAVPKSSYIEGDELEGDDDASEAVEPKEPEDDPKVKAAKQAARKLQAFLDAFTKRNKWGQRQQETIHRHDRDGEAIRRIFRNPDGTTDVRFVEPWQLANPPGVSYDQSRSRFGVKHVEGDTETPESYFVRNSYSGVDFEEVPAADISHLKCRADLNQPRGVPLFWVSRFNVRRAYKTLQNLAAKSEISAAIPFTRKHVGGTATSAASFAGGLVTNSYQDPASGRTVNKSQYGPATVLDHSDRTEYEATNFAQGMDLMIDGFAQMLRAMAAAGQMPEFMFAVDASNGNFASTLVAEGPVVRSFLTLQARLRDADLWIFDEAVKHAAASGILPPDILDMCEIQVGLPELATRDPAAEATANKTYVDLGIMSKQTLSEKIDLKYDQEQQNIKTHKEMYGEDEPAVDPLTGMPAKPGDKKPVADKDAQESRAALEEIDRLIAERYQCVHDHKPQEGDKS